MSTLFRLETVQLSDLHRVFLGWLYKVFRRLKTEARIPQEVVDIEEIDMLEENLLEWFKESEARGRSEGLQEGQAQGRRDFILRLLAHQLG